MPGRRRPPGRSELTTITLTSELSGGDESGLVGLRDRLHAVAQVESRPLGFHTLRHTFASHLIIDLRLDVVQVSRILGHASVSTTLDVYAHLFDEARHAADIRARMADSTFAGLMSPDDEGTVIVLPAALEGGTEGRSARERAAIRWAT